MINHARTLLLNVNASAQAPEGCPGEELIDPSYVSVQLPTYAQLVRHVIFGIRPDRCMLNYRAAQLMALIAVTELQEFVTALDPRITYPSATDLVGPAAFQPNVLTLSGGNPAIQGSPIAPDAAGRCLFDFDITLDGDAVTLKENIPVPQNGFWNPPFTDGLSAPIQLGGSGYSLLLPTGGGQWKVMIYNRPQWDVGQLVPSLAVSGEANLLQLFGVQPTGPYKTFHDCWTLNPLLPYKLGGLVLALIYRAEEIRSGVSLA